MPYQLFWRGPLEAFWHYREKALLESREKQQAVNFSAWIQGLYVREALGSVYHLFNALAGRDPKIFPYPSKPFGTGEPELPAQEEERRQAVIQMIQEHNLLIKVMTQDEGALGNGTNSM